MRNSKTAILLFTRSASEEADIKVFDAKLGKRGNTRVASQLIRHIHRTAVKTGCDVHLHDTDKQVGDSFGQRLSHAFSQLFNRGYEHVIAIGNDSPHLTPALLKNAIRELESGQQVLGPASDGGAYLIGLSEDYFNQPSFTNLPWKSTRLFETLKEELWAQGAVIATTVTLDDVDNAADFGRLLRGKYSLNSLFLQLRFALLSLMASYAVTLYYYKTSLHIQLMAASCRLLRAPPAH